MQHGRQSIYGVVHSVVAEMVHHFDFYSFRNLFALMHKTCFRLRRQQQFLKEFLYVVVQFDLCFGSTWHAGVCPLVGN
jgi:hypothetical protein